MKSLYSFIFRVESASNVKLSESLATNSTENLLKKFILRTAGVVALFLFLGGSVWGQAQTNTYSTAGTYQWVCPPGVTSITVQAWGGGGAGGGVNTTLVNKAGGGGGGGAYATSTLTVVPGTSYTVVVGAGGSGVSAANGNNGAASSFNTNFVIAAGGNGGLGHTGATATAMNGGLGGAAASCTPSLGAFSGGLGGTSATTPTSGGGGGGAGSTAAGGAASGATAGTGGSIGGGAGAAGLTTNSAGGTGTAPGGGGSGGRGGSGSSTARAGGAGGAGQIIISYNGYCNPYCTATAAPTTYFTNCQITGGISSLNQTSTSVVSGYSNYYPSVSASAYPNTSLGYSVTMTGGTAGIAIWVDWNNNGVFTDAGETIYNSAAYMANGTYTGSFTVPSTQAAGNYVVRIRTDFNATSPSSCATATASETEDYKLTVVSLPACSAPTSLAATVTSSAQTNTTISGAFTAATTAPSGYVVVRTTTNTQPTLTNGTTYTVGVSGSNYIEYAGASAGSWSSTGLTAGNTYYYWVFSYNNTSCSGGPAYSATAATLTQATSSCSGASLANLSYTLASPTYCSGVAISTNTATLGTTNGTVTYSVSPALPTGLTLNTSTGAITGTPSATSAATAYTVTANNGCTSTTATVTIAVVTPLSALSYTTVSPTYCVGTAITSNAVTITGGGTITYSVSPALPIGLSLNTATGEITGTPTVSAASASYTVTATNGSCSTTKALTIVVNNNLSSSTLTYTSQAVSYCRGAVITTNSATLNPSTNNGTVTYTVSPTLPAGLSLNGSTGAITGTPTVSQSATSYTITATSACGGSTTSVVTITINELPTISISSSTNTYCSTAVALTASGASTYTWSPSTGLSGTTGTTVNASPTATTTYTATGTDANGCVGTATKVITKGNPVTLGSVTAAQPSACAGGTVQLNGSAAISSAVTSYSFSASASTYATVTGTDLTGTANLGDDVGSGNLPIGFTFPYNGSTHTVFAMSSNGLLILGNTTAALTGFSSNALASTANVIAALWDDNNTTGGTMTYVTSGSAPNRVLTAQWTNMHVAGIGSSTNPTISVQVQLYESGVIKINYGATSAALSSPTASVGISGASGSYLSVTSASPITASTVSSSAENTSINTTNLASGTVFTFSPPSITYTWTFTNNSNSLSSTTVTNPIATVYASDTYTLTATGSDGCSATGSASIALGGGSPTVTSSATSTSLCVGGSTTLSSTITGGCSPFTYSWSDGTSVVSTSASFIASPTTTKTYTLTVTDNNSSTGTSSVTITVNSLPTVTVNSGTFCSAGSPLTLTATGASTYAWSPSTGLSASTGSSVNANPTSTSTYTVTGTDGNGCISSATSTVTYTQSPSAITISQTPASVCSGSVATLTTSGGTFPTSVITIGAGTVQNSSTASYSAFNGYRSSQWSQTIYTASELTTAGILPGAISSLAYNISTQGSSTSNNITIKIGTTAQQVVGTNFMSTVGFTTVYGPSAYTHTSSGWQTITFANNFIWDGVSNLVIDVWQDGPNSSANPLTYMTTLTSYRSLYTYNTSTAGITGTQTFDRMNIRFTNVPNQPTFAWSPTTNLYTNAGATTAYTGGSATIVYAVNTASTQYTATSTNGSCSTSTSINTSVNPIPTITLGTASAVCAGGTTSSLNYTATTGNPDNYIIDFDATANAAGFIDVTAYTAFSSSPITLSIPSGAAAGTYNGTITVKNSTTGCIGSATSFTVTVNAPVAISSQPNNSVSLEGSDATFSVTATGTGLTYQWQVSTDSGSSWNNASGTSTNSSYTAASITASMAGYQYRCVVSGTAPCGSVTSSVATLTISTTAITSQPAPATICSNGSNTFSISTSGSTPTYQWQVSTDAGVSYTDISGAITSSLTVSGLTATNSGNRYRCVLSGSIYSDAAVLTVYDAVAIGTQPTSLIVCSNASSASFSVSATGSNLTYQWQVSTNGGSSWSNASGTSTASTYTISTITNSLNLNQYRVVVSGSSPCAAVTSDAATLNVVGVSLAASSASICMNGSFTLTATPTSGSPTLSYSWICATAGSGATTANTSNPATITPTAVGSYTYTLTTTGGGCTLTSTASVTVNANPSITSATASPSSVCAGSNVSLSATGQGSGPTTMASYTSPPAVTYPTSDEDVSGIVITQGSNTILSNSSANNSLVGTIGTASGTAGSYSDFTGFGPFTLTGGNSYNFTVSSSTSGSAYSNALAIYIDYNRDGDFVDAGEQVYTSAATTSGAHSESGSFTVPISASAGYTRMRVISNEGLISSPTATVSYGEFEEYKINLIGDVSSNSNWSWNTTPALLAATGTTAAANNSSLPISQTYSVTATNPTTGCTSTATTSAITINPVPSAPTVNNSIQCGPGIPAGSVVSTTGATTPIINWYSNAGATTLASVTYTGGLINYYSNNFSSNSGTGTLTGSASVTSGKLQITSNTINLLGAMTIPASGVNADKYRVSFDLITSSIGGADGLSYAFGDDISATSTTPQAEHGNGSKLSVAFDDYGTGTGAAGVRVIYGTAITDPGTTVGTNGVLAYSSSTPWMGANVPVVIDIDNLGRLTLTINGTAVFSNVQLPAAYLSANKATWLHCFKGRTGGIANEHSVDNLTIQQSAGPLALSNSVSSTVTYYVTETVGTCSSVAAQILFTVNTPPAITASASSSTICSGQSTTLSASSSNSGYSYTWSNSAGSGNSVNVSPSTTTTYTVTGTDNSGGGNNGCSSTANVSVTVNPVPSAIAISPTSSTLCFGNNTSLAALNASSVVTIGTQVSTSVAANTPYRQSTGAANQSRVQYLITKAEMNSAGISGPTTISSLGFNVTAAGTGTISTYTIGMVNSNLTSLTSTYQAPTFTNVYSGTNILPVVGINTHSFQTPFNWDGTSNILINICHQGAGGTVSTVSVYTPTVTSTTSGGGANQCSLTTGGVTNTSKPVMYLGTYVTNNISWLPLTELYTDAAATTAYTGTAAATVYAKPTTTTTYTATATSAAGCTSSNTVQVTVSPTSVAGTASSDQTICSGVTPNALTLTGNTGTIQWQSSTTSTTAGFTNITGETNATLTLGALTTTTYYRAVVTSGVCTSVNSNAVTITVNAIPSAPIVTVVDNCDGTSELSTTATGTLAWSNGASTTPITVSTAGTYTVTQTANGCTSAAGSGVAAPKSTPATPVVSVTNDCGLSTLSFTPAANATILWSNNATTSSTTTTSSETLTVVQTLNGCPSAAGSGSAVPLVIPSAPTATASQNFCVTDNATVGSLAYTSVAGNTYTWYDAATAGNTVATSTQLPTGVSTYYLSTAGSNGCTSTTRTAVSATEAEQALAAVSISGGSSCEGTAITFTATPTNGGNSPTYQWYNGGVPITGETGNTYIATGLAEGAVITVKMIPSGSCVTVCP